MIRYALPTLILAMEVIALLLILNFIEPDQTTAYNYDVATGERI